MDGPVFLLYLCQGSGLFDLSCNYLSAAAALYIDDKSPLYGWGAGAFVCRKPCDEEKMGIVPDLCGNSFPSHHDLVRHRAEGVPQWICGSADAVGLWEPAESLL